MPIAYCILAQGSPSLRPNRSLGNRPCRGSNSFVLHSQAAVAMPKDLGPCTASAAVYAAVEAACNARLSTKQLSAVVAAAVRAAISLRPEGAGELSSGPVLQSSKLSEAITTNSTKPPSAKSSKYEHAEVPSVLEEPQGSQWEPVPDHAVRIPAATQTPVADRCEVAVQCMPSTKPNSSTIGFRKAIAGASPLVKEVLETTVRLAVYHNAHNGRDGDLEAPLHGFLVKVARVHGLEFS